MPVYRSLKVSILIYDLLRLFGILWILPGLMIVPEAEGGIIFPLFVYGAPNALFPLMGFFLVVNVEDYKPFTFLYIAGKAIAITANLGWFFFSLPRLPEALIANTLGTIFTLGFLLILAVLDALAVLGVSVCIIKRRGEVIPAEGDSIAAVPAVTEPGVEE
jgi:hypothetical protein